MTGVGYPKEFRDKLCARVDAGEARDYVARSEGVAYSTLRLWLHERNTHQTTYADLRQIHAPKVITTDAPPGKRIIVIGDMQVKPDLDLGYCRRVGQYCADKRPDVIVNIGDFADMPSLSFHDEPGSLGYEGQRYKRDIEAAHNGMAALMAPIKEAMKTVWKPRLVMTLGNHEDRIDRTIKSIPKLDGVMGLPDLEYERWGWEVYPFLKPVIIDGVAFCHYFCSGQMGRPISSARAILTKMHMSAVAGHQQGRDMAMARNAAGRAMTAIICGSTYEHDEKYLNAQTNTHWRGLYVLNDLCDGEFEEVAVSMKYLRRRYGE